MLAQRILRALQVIVMAVMLVPLGAVAVETSPITCSFGAGYFTTCGAPVSDPDARVFDFGDYSLTLGFQNRPGSFDVTVTDLLTDQATLAAGGLLPGYECVPFATGSPATPCVTFNVSAPSSSPTTWVGLFNATMQWTATAIQSGSYGRLLSAPAGQAFDQDLCAISGCSYSDTSIGGSGDFLASLGAFTATASTDVPEPGSLLLMGTGALTLLTGLRRCLGRTRTHRHE